MIVPGIVLFYRSKKDSFQLKWVPYILLRRVVMSLNSNKRKSRIPPNSKPGRPRIPLEKNHAVEGVYNNARFMHAAASLVGCVVHVQVKSGACYEGIFRTFSNQMDVVLEMVQKVDKKITSTAEISPAVNNLLTSMNAPDTVTEKLIFKLKDIVIISAINLDLDYANKDNFTDSAISKFNGQVVEKELEPWDELCEEKDGMKTLEGEVDEANGWDANDMFRTNAEKYGVVSSYDSTLHGYTVPLEQKNTEEYKRQEAEASKLAQEIENSYTYRNRIMLENGDEEERHSAVIRPESNSSNSNNNTNNNNSSGTRYGPPMRRKNMQLSKGIRSSPQVTGHPTPNRSHTSVENQHNSAGPYYSHYKSNSSPSSVSIPSSSSSTSSVSKSPTIPTTHSQQYTPPVRNQSEVQQPDTSERKVNGMPEKEELKPFITEKPQPVPSKETIPTNPPNAVPSTSTGTVKQSEKKKEIEKKGNNQKANREENLEALKKFSSEFKLAEENKEIIERKEIHQKNEPSPTTVDSKPKLIDSKKENECEAEVELDDQESNPGLKSPDSDSSASNPNKKYVLNPNAEVFTPRTLPIAMPTGPPSLQPRLHTPSPIVQVPQHQIMHSLPQPIFTTTPFVVSGTPVSMPITTPFGPTATVAPASRFRKGAISGVQVLPQRPEMSPPVHVAAATGPPILAPAHPPLTVQYTPPPGVMPGQGPQPTMPYLQLSQDQAQQNIVFNLLEAASRYQMYSVVGPRVMSPQPVAVVPTSHAASYGETHLPAPMYMPAHPGATVPMSAMPQGTPGSHSNASTPQSQTPTMHAPSPVHQPPVSHGTPAHTPTPTGHLGTVHTPQPVLYHGPMTSQHSLQHVGNPPHMSISHPHHSGFPAAPQPMVLMHQQHVPSHHHSSIPSSGPHALQGHHLHGQTPGNHLLQPGGIPTSATMVPVPPNASFVPHHQVGMFSTFRSVMQQVDRQ